MKLHFRSFSKYIALIFLFLLYACAGGKVYHDFYIGNGKDIGYSSSQRWIDHSSDIDLKSGLESTDFYITEAQYEFLKAVYKGVTIEGKDSGEFRTPVSKELDSLFAKAALGNHIARERIDKTFNVILEDIYPKGNPIAQYNLGLYYIDIKDTEAAQKWLQLSSNQGFLPAIIKLMEMTK